MLVFVLPGPRRRRDGLIFVVSANYDSYQIFPLVDTPLGNSRPSHGPIGRQRRQLRTNLQALPVSVRGGLLRDTEREAEAAKLGRTAAVLYDGLIRERPTPGWVAVAGFLQQIVGIFRSQGEHSSRLPREIAC